MKIRPNAGGAERDPTFRTATAAAKLFRFAGDAAAAFKYANGAWKKTPGG
jgi:hypothetical protein